MMVVAGFLTLASTAYACTTLYGKMEVKGSNNGITRAVGDYAGSMTFCTGYPISVAPGGAKSHSAGTFAVTVAGESTCRLANKLPSNGSTVYDVNFVNTVGTSAAYTCTSTCATTGTTYISNVGATANDCMDQTVGGVVSPISGTKVGTITVDATGGGTGNYTLPTGLTNNNSTDASNVCVTNSTGTNGMFDALIIY